jgi:membrane protease YdiL (CAAX protease family)
VQAAAELVALLLSALVFSAFHLHSVQAWLGLRGERFDAGLFLWRVSAGLVLGGLFRWRGFGVAAWCHAVFNLGLALGIKLL